MDWRDVGNGNKWLHFTDGIGFQISERFWLVIIQRSNLTDLEAYSSSMLFVQLCYSPTTSIKAGQDAGRAARNRKGAALPELFQLLLLVSENYYEMWTLDVTVESTRDCLGKVVLSSNSSSFYFYVLPPKYSVVDPKSSWCDCALRPVLFISIN